MFFIVSSLLLFRYPSTTSNSKHSYPILFSSHLSRVAPHFSTPLPIPRVKRWLSQGIFVKDWMMRVKQCPRSLWLSEATSASDLTPMWGSRRSSRWWVGMLCFFVRCLFVCCFGSGFDIRETSKKKISSFRYCTSVLKFIGFWKVLSDMGVSKNRGTPKSSILIGFSLMKHPFWRFSHYFWFNTYID